MLTHFSSDRILNSFIKIRSAAMAVKHSAEAQEMKKIGQDRGEGCRVEEQEGVGVVVGEGRVECGSG